MERYAYTHLLFTCKSGFKRCLVLNNNNNNNNNIIIIIIIIIIT